jgi:hypothetical protein
MMRVAVLVEGLHDEIVFSGLLTDDRAADAHHTGRLRSQLVRPGRYAGLVVDVLGYIAFEPEVATLFFNSSAPATAGQTEESRRRFVLWRRQRAGRAAVGPPDAVSATVIGSPSACRQRSSRRPRSL